MNSIQLKTVCPIPLKKMKSCNTGFYCGSCSQTVIDARDKSKEEIYNLKSTGACVLFHEKQLSQPKFSIYKKAFFKLLTLVALLGFHVKPMQAQTTKKKKCSSESKKTEQHSMTHPSNTRHRHKHTKGIVMWRKRDRKKYDRVMYGFF